MKEFFRPEMIKQPDFAEILQTALLESYRVHNELGEHGEEKIEKNQFGDTALRVDIESEKVILECLKQAKVPIRVISEEHGQVDIVEDPIYLGILDGLDGSNRYEAGRGVERYGTMFGIFSNLNPVYGDYLVSGIMEHTTGKLYAAEKEKGSTVMQRGGKTAIFVSGQEKLNERTRVYVNQYWEICRTQFSEKFRGLQFTDPRAYATYFSDLASGEVDLVVSSTGKNNLELAIGYGLITEAGGVIVDVNGEMIGDKKYLEFGQKETIPVIASSSTGLAKQLIQHVNAEK